jgi:hypothetical protein
MTTVIETNLATGGYGCFLDGVQDDSPGLEAHRQDAITKQGAGPDYNIIRCTVPPGSKITPNTGITANNDWPFRGIKRFILSGYGAYSYPGARTMLWGAPGHPEDSFAGAVLVADANAGATSVTLQTNPATTTNITNGQDNGNGEIRLTVGDASTFSTGQIVPITGVSFGSTLGRYYEGVNIKIKVINGTTIDLPLCPYGVDGATYDSGGGTVGAGVSLAFLGFEVGRWVMMSGFDLQSNWRSPAGYPNNNFYFEFLKIASISGNTITFDRPLQNDYKSTWPMMNCGKWVGAPFPGGPAALFGLSSNFGYNNGDWDCEHVYAGLDIRWVLDKSGGQLPTINGNGRDITYLDSTWSGNTLQIPTQSKVWRMIGCDLPFYPGDTKPYMEVDKFTDKAVFWNTTFGSGSGSIIQFQSSSGANDLIIGGGSNIETIQSLGRRAIFVGSSTVIGAALLAGAYAYGRNDSIYAKDLTITGATVAGAGVIFTGVSSSGMVASGITMSGGGTITMPKSGNVQGATEGIAWCVPGTWCFFTWAGGGENTAWLITGVTETETDIIITTNRGSGFPSTGGQPLYIYVCPCPDFYFDNVQGQSALSALTPRANLPVTTFNGIPAISTSTNNGITTQVVPRSFLAKF